MSEFNYKKYLKEGNLVKENYSPLTIPQVEGIIEKWRELTREIDNVQDKIGDKSFEHMELDISSDEIFQAMKNIFELRDNLEDK
tara:strand:+ start:591 stop:842 length:252 start_codon:yes stop_codon:yes gene_type:complete